MMFFMDTLVKLNYLTGFCVFFDFHTQLKGEMLQFSITHKSNNVWYDIYSFDVYMIVKQYLKFMQLAELMQFDMID